MDIAQFIYISSYGHLYAFLFSWKSNKQGFNEKQFAKII